MPIMQFFYQIKTEPSIFPFVLQLVVAKVLFLYIVFELMNADDESMIAVAAIPSLIQCNACNMISCRM